MTFDTDGGTPVPDPQIIPSGSYATEPSPEPTKQGFTFGGWYKEGEIPATWEGNIPVIFNMNGGTPQFNTEYIESGDYAIEPSETPTLEGFEFLGWYKAGEIPDDWDGVTII